jgi:hypothetical protein
MECEWGWECEWGAALTNRMHVMAPRSQPTGEAAQRFENMSVGECVKRVMEVLRGIYEPQGVTVHDPLQVSAQLVSFVCVECETLSHAASNCATRMHHMFACV